MRLHSLCHICLSPSITSQMKAHTYTLFLFNTYNDFINRNATSKSVWHQSAAAESACAYLHCSVGAHEKEFCSPLRSLKRCCVVWDYLLSPSLFQCAAGCCTPLLSKALALSPFLTVSDTLASPRSITSS